MSETTSPSVHLHPISPSSSLSSTDSAPRSEPTSDEQPDLGAFNTVLREWTHLQPPPRIPVQIRSATSSTTPTFQPSVAASPSIRSRISSLQSSFTRPPSSSAQPEEGSTVWAHAPIASYLLSATPSNDYDIGVEESEYTPSPPNSLDSTSLTVEITSEIDIDLDESIGRVDSSLSPVPVPLEGHSQRLDSRETAHPETEESPLETSRDFQDHSTTISPQSQDVATMSVTFSSQSDSQSTTSSNFMDALPIRSRNPLPPRTTSDSSFTTSNSISSSISLLSYQVPETPDEDSDSPSQSRASAISGSLASHSQSLKTQRSFPTSSSESTSNSSLATQRPPQSSQRTFHTSVVGSQYSSTGSPLPNPHSPMPIPELDSPRTLAMNDFKPNHNTRRTTTIRTQEIVDDLGTPEQPPSETFLFDPPRGRKERSDFRLIIDDDEDDEDVIAERKSVADTRTAYGKGRMDRIQSGNPQTLHPTADNSSNRPSDHLIHGRNIEKRNADIIPRNEDDDEYNTDEDYPYRYPYAHGLAPGVHGPALTPRGILPSSETRVQAQFPTTSQNDHFSKQLSDQTTSTNTQRAYVQQSTNLQSHQQLSMRETSATAPAHSQESDGTNINPTSSSHPHVPYDRSFILPTSSTQHVSQPQAPQSQPTSSSTQPYSSFSQSRGRKGPTDAYTSKHGYPHSLLGLHALPASFVSPDPEELPTAFDFDKHIGSKQNAQVSGSYAHGTTSALAVGVLVVSNVHQVSAVSVTEPGGIDSESSLDQAVPSLGVLDGVLNFIAVERERARTNAAREGSNATFTAADIDNLRASESGEEEDAVGEDDWKHIVENDQEQPKRKRRRKRPPRSHGAAAAQAQSLSASSGVDVPKSKLNPKGDRSLDDTTVTAGVSPSKKKRSKSTSASTSTSTSLRSLLLDDAHRVPLKNKGKEKEFLVAPAALSVLVPGIKEKDDKQKAPVTILRRPVELLTKVGGLSDDDDRDGLSDGDGGKTPTNFGQTVNNKVLGDSFAKLPLNLTGKKGRRIGRRERDKEFRKRDAMQLEVGIKDERRQSSVDQDFDFGFEYDDVNEDDEDESQDEEEGDRAEGNAKEEDENDSLSNMALLQPPRKKRDRSRRRKGRDTAYIHDVAGVFDGAYRSTPATPGRAKEYDQHDDGDELRNEQADPEGAASQPLGDEDDVFGPTVDRAPTSEKKKRIRKRPKTITHAKSVPDLKVDSEVAENSEMRGEGIQNIKSNTGNKNLSTHNGPDILEMDRNELEKYISATYTSSRTLMGTKTKNQPPPDSKRGRLVALANQLRELFPEQSEELGKVITRITKQDIKSKKSIAANVDDVTIVEHVKTRPVAVPGTKRKRLRKGGHIRTGSEGATGGEELDDDIAEEDSTMQTYTGFPDIHEEEEEIDPRGRPPKRGDALIHIFIDHSNILIGLLSHLKRHQIQRRNFTRMARPLPAILTKTTTSSNTGDKVDPVSAFAAVKSTTGRPLPKPTNGDTGTPSNGSNPIQFLSASTHPIPLPSFATMPRSLPTRSVLGTHMAAKDNGRLSDDTKDQREKYANADEYDHSAANYEDISNGPNSLFIGSAKSKEKKVLKHLWHAALTLILERGRPVTRRVVVTSSPLYQPMEAIERLGYELRVFIRVPDLGDGQDRERYRDKEKNGQVKSSGSGKSAQSSPVTTKPISGLPISAKNDKGIGHVRQISGSTSADSGSGGATGSSGRSLHPYYSIANGSSQTRVKFREQGVDELLQLKLHQALAATDDVPDGSTIVLATGDGNMGQFNEDGFLGPVRTALRRGWKVELYAWEDGLSRAWRREFGEGSEWGRRGMFRIIGMEQFASGLVESNLA